MLASRGPLPQLLAQKKQLLDDLEKLEAARKRSSKTAKNSFCRMGESLTFTCVDEFFVKRVYFSCEHGGRTLRDEGAMCDADNTNPGQGQGRANTRARVGPQAGIRDDPPNIPVPLSPYPPALF
eukprot:scaffold6786_cov112-Isochrysis_galbana.AAC.8